MSRRSTGRRWRGIGPIGLVFAVACGRPPADSGAPSAELPPPETGVEAGGDTGFPIFPVEDTGDALGDEQPEHELWILQEGSWQLEPAGGPYERMTGSLRLRERIDGDFQADTGDSALPPADSGRGDTGEDAAEPIEGCDVRYALAGELVEPGCVGCTFSFAVEHELLSGEPADCLEPDAPSAGALRVLGYHPASQTLQLDYGGTGVWIPWYGAVQAGDEILFEWSSTTGVAVDEEDP